MKASLNLALSIGLMATLLQAGQLPAYADADKPNTAKQEEKKSSPTEAAKSKLQISQSTAPFAETDARMVRVERRIVEDLASGRLSPDESDLLKKQLDQVAEAEAQFRTNMGKNTHWQNVRLNTLLDNLSDEISKHEHDRDMASADLQFTREDLQQRIDLAAKQGRLTPNEVADLKQRFNRITAFEAALLKDQGRLTYLDKLMLCIDFDHLGLRLSSMQSGQVQAFVTNSAEIDESIASKLKAGKLTEAQAQEFKKELGEIKSAEATIKKDPKRYSSEDLIVLGLKMDTLSNNIELAAEPRDIAKEIDSRIRSADRKLATGLNEGTLTALETYELKEDLDAIQSAKEKLSSGGSLKDADQEALKLDIARLEGRIDRQMHTPSRIWPGLTISLVHLSDRVKSGVKSNRLSGEDSKPIRQELFALNKLRRDAEQSDGGLSCAAALEMAQEFQKISARFEKALKDRPMDVPSIDGIRTAVDNRIAESAISGQLSAGDAVEAVRDLAAVNRVKEKYQASDNELTSREKFAVAFELERLSAQLEEEMHGHSAYFPGLDTRRGQIEALIYEGVSSGRLTNAEADSYKAKLADNSKLEKQYRAEPAGLSGEKALELVRSLEQEWEDLDRQLRETHVLTADIVSLEGNVEKKIRLGLSYGLLSALESETLRASYDAVVNAFNKMRADDGGLSYGERLAFSYGFQRLLAHAERNIHSTPYVFPNLEERKASINRKLGNLIATGKIPVQEARDLKALLDEITRTEAESRGSGGGLSYQEGLILLVDLNRLDKRVDQRTNAMKAPAADIDTMQRELEKKLEEAKSKNSISAENYKALKEDLDRIASNEAAYRISDEALDFAESLNLVSDLESVKDRLAHPNASSKNAATEKPAANKPTEKKKVSDKAADKAPDKKKDGDKVSGDKKADKKNDDAKSTSEKK